MLIWEPYHPESHSICKYRFVFPILPSGNIMKKLYIIITCIILGMTRGIAQDELGVGIKGGLSLATQKTSGAGTNVEVENRFTGHGGAYVNYFLSKKFAVQSELLVSMKGSTWDDPYFKGVERLTYLDIPVLARYQIVRQVNVHAGPQFGFLLSAKNVDEIDDVETDVREFYKTLDLGLAMGAELNLPKRINITIRYILGLSTVTEPDQYVDEWKNHVLQVAVGFRLIGD
jgi:hypothetical protein